MVCHWRGRGKDVEGRISREGIPAFVDVGRRALVGVVRVQRGCVGGGFGQRLNRMSFRDGASDLFCPAWHAQLRQSK